MRRTVNEDDFKQKWAEHSRYFKSTDARSQRQETWTSKQCFQDRLTLDSTDHAHVDSVCMYYSMAAYQAQLRKKDV